MKEIVILSPGPFFKRDYDRFGIELLKKKFVIKILDFTAWLNPIFWKKIPPYQNHFRMVIFHFRGYYEHMKRSFYARLLQKCFFCFFSLDAAPNLGKSQNPRRYANPLLIY